MPREVTDKEGTSWTIIEAYAGLSDAEESGAEAARVSGEADLFHVVCTPAGGEQTVRLKLAGDWQEAMSDEALLAEIEANKN